jgi:hypothetical protein
MFLGYGSVLGWVGRSMLRHYKLQVSSAMKFPNFLYRGAK